MSWLKPCVECGQEFDLNMQMLNLVHKHEPIITDGKYEVIHHFRVECERCGYKASSAYDALMAIELWNTENRRVVTVKTEDVHFASKCPNCTTGIIIDINVRYYGNLLLSRQDVNRFVTDKKTTNEHETMLLELNGIRKWMPWTNTEIKKGDQT